MAFQIILEMGAAPRMLPKPASRRWRERGGILFINQRRGRKPKAKLSGPLAPLIEFPVDPIELLLGEHARVLWACNEILYPDEEETISFDQFRKQCRLVVDTFRNLGNDARLEKHLEKIRNELTNGKRCLEDHADGVPLDGYRLPEFRGKYR